MRSLEVVHVVLPHPPGVVEDDCLARHRLGRGGRRRGRRRRGRRTLAARGESGSEGQAEPDPASPAEEIAAGQSWGVQDRGTPARLAHVLSSSAPSSAESNWSRPYVRAIIARTLRHCTATLFHMMTKPMAPLVAQ